MRLTRHLLPLALAAASLAAAVAPVASASDCLSTDTCVGYCVAPSATCSDGTTTHQECVFAGDPSQAVCQEVPLCPMAPCLPPSGWYDTCDLTKVECTGSHPYSV
ncbi:MAG: hypothetical protein V4510_08390 [bacterium]